LTGWCEQVGTGLLAKVDEYLQGRAVGVASHLMLGSTATAGDGAFVDGMCIFIARVPCHLTLYHHATAHP
jgi:hypothetical protein